MQIDDVYRQARSLCHAFDKIDALRCRERPIREDRYAGERVPQLIAEGIHAGIPGTGGVGGHYPALLGHLSGQGGGGSASSVHKALGSMR